jgi:hypothetical protein
MTSNLHLGFIRYLFLSALALASMGIQGQTLAPTEAQEAPPPDVIPNIRATNPPIVIDTATIPQELRGWIPWIETKNPSLQCAWNNGDHACVFASALEMSNSSSAKHTLSVSFYAQATGIQMEIPKVNASTGTQQVNVVSSLQYVHRNNETWIALPKGKTTVTFEVPADWRELKMSLPPSSLGRTMLAFNAKIENGKIVRQARQADNAAEQSENQRSNDAIQVFRNYQDGYPALLRTKLLISSNENGKVLPLGKIIPQGFTIAHVQTNTSLNQHPDGSIDASVNRGTYYIDIDAYSNIPPETVSILGLVNGTPTEYWSIQSNNNIRQLDIQGKAPVDPLKVGSASHFGPLPTYAVEKNIVFKTLRQGISLKDTVEMTIRRTSWFGFSNNGMLHLDQAAVNNQGVDTLIAKDGITIQGATLNEQPQVIYKHEKNDAIQLPLGTQTLKNVFVSTTDIPLSSWKTPGHLQQWTLYTAPRHHVVWSSSDQAHVSVPSSWEGSWNLYKIFSVFLLCLITYKSFGTRLAVAVGLGMLTFSNHVLFSWSYWVISLGIMGILHFKSRLEGSYLLKFSKWTSVMFLLVFAWSTMLFTVNETRAVFNPGAHLEPNHRVAYDVRDPSASHDPAELAAEGALGMVARSNSAIQAKTLSSERYSPQAIESIGQDVAQAMSPTPSWHQWNVPQFQIYVQNIQDPNAMVTFWIAGPKTLALVSLVQVLVLFGLLGLLINTVRVGFFNKPSLLAFLGKSQ